MDSMRAILMMLGVVFHSAYVFVPEWNFVITGESQVIGAKPLAVAIHAFRMHAFFVVSGFFCVLTLSNYGWQRFLRVRMVRILVPLIVTGVTLNSLQTILTTKYTGTVFSLQDYLLEGGWDYHLWFLVNLFVYFLIAALLTFFAARPLAKIGRQVSQWLLSAPIIIVLLFMPFATISIYALARVGFPLESELLGVFSMARLTLYAPFFVFGAFLASDRRLLTKFSDVSLWNSVGLIVLTYWARDLAGLLDHFAETVVTVYCDSLIAWLATALCFYVFRRFFNKQTRAWLFLSDASYTVYLFHLLFVIGFGIVLIRFNVNGVIAMPLLMVATACVTLAIHAFVIRKSRVARFLYNGK